LIIRPWLFQVAGDWYPGGFSLGVLGNPGGLGMYSIFSWLVYSIAAIVTSKPPAILTPKRTHENIIEDIEASVPSAIASDIVQYSKVQVLWMQVLRVVAGAVVVFSCPASKKFGEVEVIHALSGNSFVLQQTAMIYIYIHRKKCSRHNLLPPSRVWNDSPPLLLVVHFT
jgi:hypothetical protein